MRATTRRSARWSVRLIAEEAVKRKLASKVGRETIRILLQSHDLKPWREKMWCVAKLNEEYIARMEDVLKIYEKPLSEREPVVYVDEKPVVLHADVRPCGRYGLDELPGMIANTSGASAADTSFANSANSANSAKVTS